MALACTTFLEISCRGSIMLCVFITTVSVGTPFGEILFTNYFKLELLLTEMINPGPLEYKLR